MVKTIVIVIDMDGTLIDFAQGCIELALRKMSNPEYYKGLPLTCFCYSQFKTLKDMGIKLRILSGVADPVGSPKYITHVDYNSYFARVCEIKTQEIVRLFGVEHPFESIDFIKQSDSKADFYQRTYGTQALTESILIDDYHRYCKEWQDLGGTAYQVGKDIPSLAEALEHIISWLQKEEEE